jgi:hypothetical protein
MERVF